jgi:hypothetical protein
MQMGSLVKWWTMNKIDGDSHIGKSSNAQIKKGWDFPGFLDLAKSLMQRALEMFGIAKIGQDFHPKGAWKGDHFDLWITMN